MRARYSNSQRFWIGAIFLSLGLAGPASWSLGASPSREGKSPSPSDPKLTVGRELFVREWVPNDPRSRGGDGLGPVFNAASCVACHRLGGPGGAGPVDRDVEIFTPSVPRGLADADPKALADSLIKIHPALRDARSVVLHHFGTDSGYASWRLSLGNRTSRVFSLLSQQGGFGVRLTRRNTPALFGAGLIDTISDADIETAARRVFPEFPTIQGRVARLKDDKIGRFGWKAQTASLEDFVLTACSVELGLEVPGHPQSITPWAPERKAPGLDLSREECDALIAFVRALPAPTQLIRAPDVIGAGRAAFELVGCATCHREQLGPVQGLYSDLLLHDMGPGLEDAAVYYGTPVPSSEDKASPVRLVADPTSRGLPKTEPVILGARRPEWRTPPLWGLRDSAPYLHDGRAKNLDEAIFLHGGEAEDVVVRYKALKRPEQLALRQFLYSLAAPGASRRSTH